MGSGAASQVNASAADEIRTGFIGVGVRGGSLLKQTLLEQNVRVTTICDIDGQTRDNALTVAQRHNPRGVSEWRKVLEMKEVDAVFIGAPCDLHAEIAAAFLEAGKYVYCEKPLAITPEGVDRVLKAARRSKTFLQIGQQLRYFPTMREAIRQVHEGLIGQTYVIEAHRHSGKSRSDGTQDASAQERTRTAWYADVKRSGDLIVENAVHNIDACLWIADSQTGQCIRSRQEIFPHSHASGHGDDGWL